MQNSKDEMVTTQRSQTADGWILAMDTAGESVSVALTDTAGDTTFEKAAHETNKHTETLLPLVEDVLKTMGKPLATLSAVAFSAGPGAFTGVRTACAAAQGLAWVIEKPVIAVPTLAAAAIVLLDACPEVRRVMPVLDARMKECYVQVFERPASDDAMPCAVTEAAAVKPAEIASWVENYAVQAVGGSGLSVYSDALTGAASAGAERVDDLEVSAGVVAETARRQFLTGDVTTAALASPIYVRNRVALTIDERRRGEKL